MAELLTITDKNFEEEVLKSSTPVMIDFWAEWCRPCLMIAPAVEELADQYSGKIKVGKVDVDENGAIAQRYGILSIPTLLFLKNGKVVAQIVGAKPKKDILKQIDLVLAG